MATTDILNLDALLPATFIVTMTTRDGEERVWELSDQTSTGTLIWGLALDGKIDKLFQTFGAETAKAVTGQTLSEEEQAAVNAQAREVDIDALEAAQRDYERTLLMLCTEVFRTRYPGMTKEEVRALFSSDTQRDIIRAFSGRRSNMSTAPSSGTATNGAAMMPALANGSQAPTRKPKRR